MLLHTFCTDALPFTVAAFSEIVISWKSRLTKLPLKDLRVPLGVLGNGLDHLQSLRVLLGYLVLDTLVIVTVSIDDLHACTLRTTLDLTTTWRSTTLHLTTTWRRPQGISAVAILEQGDAS